MADGVAIALIAGSGALVIAYVNSFVAESYRRFRDGSTLAASLAGELGAYAPAWPILTELLDSIIATIDAGERKSIVLRPFERPVDLIFEDAVGKLGLLGAQLVEDVVFVYSNIRAFRVAFELICRDAEEMADAELRRRCLVCREALDRAVSKSSVIQDLRQLSSQSWRPNK